MLKRLSLLVVLVSWAHSSYSEGISPYYGQTPNAAGQGITWSMNGVLPSGVPGLDINGVIYNYTINKNVNDQVNVDVQNKNASGTGYIFRSHDEWRPGSLGGTQINKYVPVTPSNRSLWGDGEIAVDGPGSVSNPRVVYNYRVDPCFDPQSDPNCPGYQRPKPVIYEVDLTNLYDVTTDSTIDLDRKTCREGDETPECKSVNNDKADNKELTDEEKAELEAKEKEKSKDRLEKALAAADNSALFANALANAQMLQTMNLAVNMNAYYNASIPGGAYGETVVLKDTKLPENRRGLRNGFAQQILHDKLVNMQYK